MLLEVLVGALVGAGSDGSRAVVPLPCRPTIACTADIVPGGRVEAELGAQVRRLDGTGEASSPVLLKASLVDRLQLQVGTNGAVVREGAVDAPRDLFVGLKWLLQERTERLPAVALEGAVVVPSFREVGLGVDAQVQLYLTQEAWGWHADLELAALLLRLGGETRLQGLAALSVSRDLGVFGLGVMGELYAFTDAAPHAGLDRGFLFAVGKTVGGVVTFDVGGDVGLGAQSRAFTVFVGATVVTPGLW